MIWPFRRPELRILIVCTANVCRSPGAEAYLRNHLRLLGVHQRIAVSSAGTQVGSPGRPPDPRVLAIASEYGVPFPRIRAQAVSAERLARCDYIWVMEEVHRDAILGQFPEFEERIALLDADGGQLADPYYGSKADVRAVLEKIDQLTARRAAELAQRLDMESDGSA